MGQALAKKEVQEGIKCYQNQSYEVAITKWRRSLHRIRDKQHRFLTLEYLVTVHGELSQYRDMLAYAVMQIDIANDLDNSRLRAQAYLNLARSSEKLCEYHKAISYSRHCIQNKLQDLSTYGSVYLIQGKAYFGISNITKSLEMLEYAIRIAKKCKDVDLELLIYTALGEVFLELKDYEKALKFHIKARDAANTLSSETNASKYQRMAFLSMGRTYAKLNKLDQATEHIEVALRSALENDDRAVQARCLCATAHIHRQRRDPQTAMDVYESAGPLMVAVGDKLGQLEVLKGAAKTLEQAKESRACECKALEYNKKALDIAASVGNKLQMLRCCRHIERLYCCLGDHVHEETYTRRCEQLVQELDLHCTVCGRAVGLLPDTLHLYSCFHIAHQRCVCSQQNIDVTADRIHVCDRCDAGATGLANEDGRPETAPTSCRGHLDHGDTGSRQPTADNFIRNIVLET